MKLISRGSNLATSVILPLLILLMRKINPPVELGENVPSFSGKVACRLNWRIQDFKIHPPKSSKCSKQLSKQNAGCWNKNTNNIQKYGVALKLATSSIKYGWSHIVPKKKHLPNMKPLNNLPNITLTQPALRVFNNPRCFSGIWNMHREKCVAGYAISASSNFSEKRSDWSCGLNLPENVDKIYCCWKKSCTTWDV